VINFHYRARVPCSLTVPVDQSTLIPRQIGKIDLEYSKRKKLVKANDKETDK